MSEVVRLSRAQCQQMIDEALAELEALDWRSWVTRCCLHCSDFPSAAAKRAGERLDAALWLLDGRSYRDLL